MEAFYCFKEGLPVVLAANWQAASRPNHLTHQQFLAAYPKLEARAPGQNLDRRIPSKSSLVAQYILSSHTVAGTVKDASGNGYDGHLQDGVLHTPLGSKGHNYTVLLSVQFSHPPAAGTLLSGPDTSFGLASSGNGSTTLAFASNNIVYPLHNVSLPTFISSKLEIILLGTENRTSAYVDGRYAGDFAIALDGTTVLQPMAFVAPVQQIAVGNASGTGTQVNRFTVWDGLQDVSTISRAQ